MWIKFSSFFPFYSVSVVQPLRFSMREIQFLLVLMYVIVYKAYRRNTKFKRTFFSFVNMQTQVKLKRIYDLEIFLLFQLFFSLSHSFVFVKASTKLTIKPVCRQLQKVEKCNKKFFEKFLVSLWGCFVEFSGIFEGFWNFCWLISFIET